MNYKYFDVDIALLEISEPNWKIDIAHFINDRFKLGINMQCMYKRTLKKETLTVAVALVRV